MQEIITAGLMLSALVIPVVIFISYNRKINKTIWRIKKRF
jgi:hypothetical protein